MKLLVDFGNSRLKWATHEEGRLVPGGVFAHRDGGFVETLAENWSALPRPAVVLVASVAAPARERELAGFVRERFDRGAEFLVTPRAALGITTAYRKPQQLGIDRFLALAALHREQPRAQLLASLGTALTLDVLDAGGRHAGGLIAPGVALMREALARGTARLREQPGHFTLLADNTADGVFSGTRLAAIAVVGEFRARARDRFGVGLPLVLTGGGAADLQSEFQDAEIRPNLVLQGLAAWAEGLPGPSADRPSG